MGTTWVNKTIDFGDEIIFVGGDSTISSLNKLTIETTGSTKSVVVDATGDIELNPTGADILIAGVSGGAGKLTIGGTSLEVYGGDTTGDDLELYPNTADTATEYIKLLGGTSVDILSTTKINLDGAVDVSGDMVFDTAGTTAITLNAVDFTTGISITSTNLTDGIKVSGTTPVDGIEVSSACSANGIHVSGACANGIEVSGACTTAGLYISDLGAAGTGIVTIANAIEAANAKVGVLIYKNLTNSTAVGALANTNEALLVKSTNLSCASASGASTVANNLVSFYVDNDADAAGSDVWSGNVLALQYDATTDIAGTATSTASAISLDYNLTETAGTLSVDSFSVVDIDYDTSGTVSFNAGTFNVINIDMDDANVPAYASSGVINGLQINTEGLDVSDADLTLNGVKIVMPGTYGAATEYAGYFAGDGTTVAICSDGATAMTIGGTVTAGITYGDATSFLYSAGTVTNFFYASADSKGGAGATRGTPNQTATCDGSITVLIGAKTLLIPVYNAVTIA